MSEQLPNIVDEDGDVDLTKIDEPLLYKFATNELLKDANNSPKIESKKAEKEKEEEPSAETVDQDEEPSAETAKEPSADQEKEDNEPSLDTADMAQMEVERDAYKMDKEQPWIQEFLKSNEYQLIDNEGGGECLFAVIRDSFKSIDKDTSIMELRKKLSDEVTPDIYENYKDKYKMFVNTVQTGETELKELSKLNNELRDRLRNAKERPEQQLIVESAKEVAIKYKRLKSEIKISKELMAEFKFMKKVNSIEDLKKIIKTCDFWADTWSISTLERILNIKLVIFSSEAWKAGDVNNVLQCGQLNDKILEELGVFEPQYYMLLDYTGTHYKLITYKYHRLFNFNQIPYSIKLDIAKNCLQGSSGPYKIIPQFKMFNEELGIEKENTLYDGTIVFQFYNRSNDKPLPGKGNGEQIPLELVKDFSQLAEISEWRRKLDNEYTSPFEADGHKWKTVEHFYQGNKFKNTNKEFYILFTQDSGSKISDDVELAKMAGSKSGKHKGELLRSKDIKIDPMFYGGNEENVLERGIYAKFSQDKTDLKLALLNTKKAKLQHYKKGMEPEIANALMLVRSKLSAE
jgi:predicted NAD-dependent protein-ADP-ribosyltransferase YbiA (DUF1768 family)